MRRGFTLLEVVASIGLLLMLSGFMLGFVWNVWLHRDRAQAWARWSGEASALIERIERDLMGAVAGDAVVGAGIAGDKHRLRIISRGVGVEGLIERGAMPDMRAMEITYDERSGEVRIRSWTPTLDGQGGGESETVLSGVEVCRFRFFEGGAWRSSYDSLAAGRLPAAIEVALWRGPPRPSEDAMSREGSAGDADDMMGPGADAWDAFGPDETWADDPLMFVEPWRVRAPDRVRVIVVPDGPEAGWGGGA